MNICAGIVVEKVKNIGLNGMYNNITPMDGNCWYHSIREAMLGNGLDFNGYVDHVELRVAVVNFVNSFLKNEKKLEQECAMHGVHYYQPVEDKSTLPTTLNLQIPPKPKVTLSTRFLNIEKK